MEFTHNTHTYITGAGIAFSPLYIPNNCNDVRGIPIAENGKNNVMEVIQYVLCIT